METGFAMQTGTAARGDLDLHQSPARRPRFWPQTPGRQRYSFRIMPVIVAIYLSTRAIRISAVRECMFWSAAATSPSLPEHTDLALVDLLPIEHEDFPGAPASPRKLSIHDGRSQWVAKTASTSSNSSVRELPSQRLHSLLGKKPWETIAPAAVAGRNGLQSLVCRNRRKVCVSGC